MLPDDSSWDDLDLAGNFDASDQDTFTLNRAEYPGGPPSYIQPPKIEQPIIEPDPEPSFVSEPEPETIPFSEPEASAFPEFNENDIQEEPQSSEDLINQLFSGGNSGFNPPEIPHQPPAYTPPVAPPPPVFQGGAPPVFIEEDDPGAMTFNISEQISAAHPSAYNESEGQSGADFSIPQIPEPQESSGGGYSSYADLAAGMAQGVHMPPPAPPQQPPIDTALPKEPKKSRRKTFLYIGAAAAALVLGVGSFIAFRAIRGDHPTAQPDSAAHSTTAAGKQEHKGDKHTANGDAHGDAHGTAQAETHPTESHGEAKHQDDAKVAEKTAGDSHTDNSSGHSSAAAEQHSSDSKAHASSEKSHRDEHAATEHKPIAKQAEAHGREEKSTAAPQQHAQQAHKAPEHKTTAKPSSEHKAAAHHSAEPKSIHEKKAAIVSKSRPTAQRERPAAHSTGKKHSSDPNANARYVIQVYSSPSREDAEEWLAKLKKKGVGTPYLSTQQVKGKTWYRVRFGEFDSRETAENMARQTGFTQGWIDRIR
jgi:cell division protein FtsN